MVRLPSLRNMAPYETDLNERAYPRLYFSFRTYEECGSLWRSLIEEGFLDKFLDSPGISDGEARVKRSNEIEEYYGRPIFSINEKKVKENSIQHIIGNKYRTETRYKYKDRYFFTIVTSYGNFLNAYVRQSDEYRVDGERLYGGTYFGDSIYTIEGRVTWFQLYKWVEENRKKP